MQLKANQLGTQLQKSLAPLYLISGEDHLLKQEPHEAIVRKALEQGFNKKQRLQVEGRFDWKLLNNVNANQDLFFEKQIIEILNPEAKFDLAAGKALNEYCSHKTDDNLLIIISGKLNASQLKSSWYQEIDKIGVCITLWPLNPRELTLWLSERMNKAQLKAPDSTLKLLAELCENNLLAAQQAIEKLKLLYPPHTLIDTEQLMAAISDSSRYTVFDLINYALQANTQRLLHVLNCLEQQSVEPTLVLWALSKEVRLLFDLTRQLEQGQSVQKLIEREAFGKRPLLQLALRRLNNKTLKKLLTKLTELDQLIKGMHSGNIWLELNRLSLALAGKEALL